MQATELFSKWALGFAGCDGGDIGSKDSPSIWVSGIEWGGGHDLNGLLEHINSDAQKPPSGYGDWKENLSYIFNWQVMKLLAAMNGNSVTEYKEFAENVKPFVIDQHGYFKMNLYPIAFRNTSATNWKKEFAEVTGFTNRDDYINWCNDFRLKAISDWAARFLPKIIICLGKTYRSEFESAFHVDRSSWRQEAIDERDLSWAVNSHGSLVVVLPFMVNRNGLVKNASIEKFGNRLADIHSSLKK